ncbi:hypothetical protein GRI97_04845 [Altererythrobacter xixiisoli]|uniref:Uncharacterized protein n=1 Tax=Croceibacterium xixiisoli TaxID=1476466 RepID=A0A6I4TT02_9SPHN|nr:hypothetical protein [Croceibacterium xixiisoli]MXO98310.1 hypothetical protein [Croceibacterium xixiisoli]
MLKLSGSSGDGIGALGIKRQAYGPFEIAVIDTLLVQEPQPLRKTGLGGKAYARHGLEAIVLERGGLWAPETMTASLDLLERIDNGDVTSHRFEVWLDVPGTRYSTCSRE